MLAATDDSEIVSVFGQAPRELAVRELVIHDDFIHRERQRFRESLDELTVLAFVRELEEIAPQRIADGSYLLIALFDDVQAEIFCDALSLLPVTSSSATR